MIAASLRAHIRSMKKRMKIFRRRCRDAIRESRMEVEFEQILVRIRSVVRENREFEN